MINKYINDTQSLMIEMLLYYITTLYLQLADSHALSAASAVQHYPNWLQYLLCTKNIP